MIAMSMAPVRVVVGVGGGPRSVAVLRWAAYQAVRFDGELVAVHAYGAATQAAPYAPAHAAPGPGGAAGRALQLLDGCLQAAFDRHPPVPVHTVCDGRRPVQALLDYARGAALLVVGSPAPLGQGGAVLGPTARDCLRNAPCPVVLLPATDSGCGHADLPRPATAGRPEAAPVPAP